MNESVVPSKRDPYWDIVKGIAILLVVIGHCWPGFAASFANAFHLPLFVFAAGALFREKHADDPYRFAGARLKTLWKPFVLYMTILLLCHNVFVRMGIYDTALLGKKELAGQFFNILWFNNTEQMGGAMWFIPLMFAVMVAFCFAVSLAKKASPRHYKAVLAVLAVISTAAGIVLTAMGVSGAHYGQWAFLYFAMAVAGWLFCGREGWQKKVTWWGALLCLAALVGWLLVRDANTALAENVWITWAAFVPLGLLGSYAMLYVARLIGKWKILGALFAKMGRESYAIMALHFLAFKAVMAVYMAVCPSAGAILATFPAYHPAAGVLWPFYIVAGIALPILTVCVSRFIWNKIKKLFGSIVKG